MSPSGSQDNEYLCRVIDRWRQAASREWSILECWSTFSAAELARKEWPDPPTQFYSDTTYLVGQITARFPKLDPTPLQTIYAGVEAWHADHDCTRLPTMPVLLSAMDTAMMILQVAEAAAGGEVAENAVALTPEDQAILEALRNSHPTTMTQEKLANGKNQGGAGVSDRLVRDRLRYLCKKKLTYQPFGPKKGYSLTDHGLKIIGDR